MNKGNEKSLPIPPRVSAFVQTPPGQVCIRMLVLSGQLQGYVTMIARSFGITPEEFEYLMMGSAHLAEESAGDINFTKNLARSLEQARDIVASSNEFHEKTNQDQVDLRTRVRQEVGVTAPANKMMIKSLHPGDKVIILGAPEKTFADFQQGLPVGTPVMALHVDQLSRSQDFKELPEDKRPEVVVVLWDKGDYEEVGKKLSRLAEAVDYASLVCINTVDDSREHQPYFKEHGFRAIVWNESSMGPDAFFDLDKTTQVHRDRIQETIKELVGVDDRDNHPENTGHDTDEHQTIAAGQVSD